MPVKPEIGLKSKERKLFQFLNINIGIVTYGDKEIAEVWTRRELNRTLGVIASTYDVDIMKVVAPFMQAAGEKLVPDMARIASLAQKKQIGPEYITGYTFELCQQGCRMADKIKHGMFRHQIGAQGGEIICFEDALNTVACMTEEGRMSVETGVGLLQMAMANDLLINRAQVKERLKDLGLLQDPTMQIVSALIELGQVGKN